MKVNMAPPMTMTPAPWARREVSVPGVAVVGAVRGGSVFKSRLLTPGIPQGEVSGPSVPGVGWRFARPMPYAYVAATGCPVGLSAIASAAAAGDALHTARS